MANVKLHLSSRQLLSSLHLLLLYIVKKPKDLSVCDFVYCVQSKKYLYNFPSNTVGVRGTNLPDTEFKDINNLFFYIIVLSNRLGGVMVPPMDTGKIST